MTSTLRLVAIALCLVALLSGAIAADVTQQLTVPGQFATIQEAINAAADGDTVLIGPGTYTGSGNVDLVINDKSVSLVGVGGAENVILDLAAGTPDSYGLSILLAETSSLIRLRGFTMTNSGSQAIGGIYINSDSPVRIDSCRFTGLEADSGGAVYTTGGQLAPAVWIEYSVFEDNAADPTTGAGGAIMSNRRSVFFKDCLFVRNTAWRGGAVATTSTVTTHGSSSTLYGNGATDVGGGIYSSNATSFMGRILIANSTSGAAYWTEDFDEFGIAHGNFYGNVGGDWTGVQASQLEFFSNYSEPPLFCDAEAGDFTVCVESICNPDNNAGGSKIGLFGVGCTDCTVDTCCVGERGNVDQSPDEEATLGDLTVMIDHLFLTLAPLACWEEGNLDGSLPEGEESVTLADLTVLIDHLFLGLDPLPSCP